MKKNLGKLKYVPLCDVWPKEASDFTPWLAKPENMEKLGKTIGISFGPAIQEVSVGVYRADIFTTEQGTEERRVIIENQYGQTNHDHLGKIITYASGKKANIIIWIVEKATDEHKSAIHWLNELSEDKDIVFFLIEMKLIQVDDSNPAPVFEIVEGPNEFERTVNMTDTQKERISFWEQFVDYASKDKRFAEMFSKRKVSHKPYYDLMIGDKRYHFYLSNLMGKGKKGYSISVYMVNQKDLFYHLQKHAQDIEQEIGAPLQWEEFPKACTIQWKAPQNIKPAADGNLQKIFDWYIAAAMKYKDVFAKYTKE